MIKGLFIVGILISSVCRSQCLQMDLILIGDFSASVSGNEVYISEAFQSFARKLQVSPDGIKIGVIAFNSDAYLISPLNDDPYDLNSRIITLRQFESNSTTNLSAALFSATELLTKDRDVRKMIIIVSDGDVDSKEGTFAVVSQLKAIGVGICTIMIKNPSSKPEYMKAISSDCFSEADYETLGDELAKLSICL